MVRYGQLLTGSMVCTKVYLCRVNAIQCSWSSKQVDFLFKKLMFVHEDDIFNKNTILNIFNLKPKYVFRYAANDSI